MVYVHSHHTNCVTLQFASYKSNNVPSSMATASTLQQTLLV